MNVIRPAWREPDAVAIGHSAFVAIKTTEIQRRPDEAPCAEVP